MKKTVNATKARASTRPVGGRAVATSRASAARPLDLRAIQVGEVMNTDVLVLSRNDSIREAAERLEDRHISGAPVVNDAGRLVGVLTLSDIARSEHVSESGVSARFEGRQGDGMEGMVDPLGEDDELFPTEEYYGEVQGGLCVADWMTPGVIQVSPDMTLAQVCRLMLDEEIHRVFVVRGDRLVGVFSTEDVVRLVAAPRGRRGAALAR